MDCIDVHCHLYGDEFGGRDDLFEEIRNSPVKRVITSGADAASSEECMRLAEKYNFVYFTAGVHPTETGSYKEGDLDKISEMLSHPKCVALGETGLDYHYPDTDREKQKEIFIRQLSLAHGAGLPVVIHSRDSAEDMFDILRENRGLISQGALLHCYSHSPEMALEFQKMGVMFSFGGTSTYHGSKKVRRSIQTVDTGSLLTETDSPYLPTCSHQGVYPNTPLAIPEILENMARLRGLADEEMADIVWVNAHRLFKKLG